MTNPGRTWTGKPEQPEHCLSRLRPICASVTARARRSPGGWLPRLDRRALRLRLRSQAPPPADGVQGPPRRQGRQPRRDDERAEAPVPPGFTISTDACRAYMHGGWPDGLDEEIAKQVAKLEKKMGRKLGDPFDPLLVSVRSGAKFSMPGMMDTVLNLGLNDQSVKGLANVDRRRALRVRLATAASSRCTAASCSASTAQPFEHAARAGQGQGRRQDATPSSRPPTLKELCERVQGRRQGGDRASRSRRSPREQLRGAVEAVFSSWNGARAIAYRVRERISHDLGTAVNVQAMVFGNRDDNSGTGVGFTRNAATGENKPVRRLPRQRPGRGRGGRHPQHRGPRRT